MRSDFLCNEKKTRGPKEKEKHSKCLGYQNKPVFRVFGKKWVEEKKVGFFLPLLYKEARFFVLRGVWNGFLRERERDDYVIN